MRKFKHLFLSDTPQYAIYALIDPRDQSVRYVGITVDVYARFAAHIHAHGDGLNPDKDAWIRELKAVNLMVIMTTLEIITDRHKARLREGYWILHYLHLGANLFNQRMPGNMLRTMEQAEAEENEEDTAIRVRYLFQEGISQKQIIWQIWGVMPSSGKKYARARDEYLNIITKVF